MSHILLKNIHFGSTDNSILSKMCTKNWISKTEGGKKYIGNMIDIVLKQSDNNTTL